MLHHPTLVHPNVPEQRDDRDSGQSKNVKWMSAQWKNAKWELRSLYRCTLRMLWTVIAPELIMVAASDDWMAARENCREMQEYASQDGVAWGVSHSHLANMGGFVIRCKPTEEQKHHDPYHLTGRSLLALRQDGYIAKLPNITEAEIKDRSKGDALVKLIAIGQIVWSTIQIIVRAIRKLPVSPLEVAVVAFAVSAVFIYGLYWNKPQRVGTAIIIDLEKATCNMQNEGTMSDEGALMEGALPEGVVTIEGATSEEVTPEEGLILKQGAMPAKVYELLKSRGTKRLNKQFVGDILLNLGISIKTKTLPGAPISVDSISRGGTKGSKLRLCTVGVGAAVFGAVHAVAWDFTFPSTAELILWRWASIYTAAEPLCAMLLGFIFHFSGFLDKIGNSLGEVLRKTFIGVMFVLPTLLYVVARVFILVEMFRTLCFLPPRSYISTWTANIPHLA
ncbi:hypothetical protein Trihar35433_4740 [Trichoderma harzianum]|nr:hypothetical protein Trihar35433_4740 [Trichoderma harzianum]